MLYTDKIKAIKQRFPRVEFLGNEPEVYLQAVYTNLVRQGGKLFANVYGEEHPTNPSTIRFTETEESGKSEIESIVNNTGLSETRSALLHRNLKGLFDDKARKEAEDYKIQLTLSEAIKKYIVDPVKEYASKFQHRKHPKLKLINPEF